jgi:hypothetical protein
VGANGRGPHADHDGGGVLVPAYRTTTIRIQRSLTEHLIAGGGRKCNEIVDRPAALENGLACQGETGFTRRVESPFRINCTGTWSYAIVLLPYFVILAGFIWYYRILWRFRTWESFLLMACAMFLVLGLGFEWIAQMFYAWTFPPGRFFFDLEIPIFGWLTHNRVPFEELLWIAVVIPLFYYLFLWATLVFYDIIYVVDEQGKFYKKEERWAGFFKETHICVRNKGERGQDKEKKLATRRAGIIARKIQPHYERYERWRKRHETPPANPS